MNLEERVVGDGHLYAGNNGDRLWRLTILGSGNTTLNKVGGADGANYDDGNFSCHSKDVFIVTKSSYGDGSKDWEKPVTDIKLTLGKCESKDGKKVCDIEIDSNVGLAWNPQFKSKVTFLG